MGKAAYPARVARRARLAADGRRRPGRRIAGVARVLVRHRPRVGVRRPPRRSRRRSTMQASITIPADPAAPTAARRWVDDFARSLADEVRDDLRLIVTELVTNAVKYGPGDPRPRLRARAPAGHRARDRHRSRRAGRGDPAGVTRSRGDRWPRAADRPRAGSPLGRRR